MGIGIGSRVGPYEVIAPLGAGGMGEVYRARDARLNRDVALKVLPDLFAGDPERLGRFEREAHALAALTHPHIATIYGVEAADGTRALVLELVEGETLAEVLARGPLPPDEALRIARQIVDALETAHEQGIVHRDLKPANIKITPDGAVKVLDFGLAKLDATREAMSGSAPSLSMSPTIAAPTMLTGGAVLLGTAGYMAPEQARGKRTDKRADIWAFGVVLYEMLSGARAFHGDSVTEVAGAVIHKDPDWRALPSSTSPLVRMIVERCLQKDPKQRFRDMGDVRLALDGAFSSSAAAPSPASVVRPASRIGPALTAALAAAILTGGAVWILTRDQQPPPDLLRLELAPVPLDELSPLIDISPDGRTFSFIASDSGGVPRLWVRPIDSLDSRVVAAGDQVRFPSFWSPDSRFLAYFSDGKVKKVPVGGGPAETIADVPNFAGGTWGRNGVIVFSTGSSIMRVAAAGGTPTEIIPQTGQGDAVLPLMLPDGRRFLYLRLTTNEDVTGIYAASLDAAADAQPTTRILATNRGVVYAPGSDGEPDHLLFTRDGLIVAQEFDADRLALVGEVTPLGADRVEVTQVFPSLAVATNGTLVYRRSRNSVRTLSAVDRKGVATALLPGGQVAGENPRLSPDGKRLALIVDGQLWAYDLTGRPPIKLTFDGQQFSPMWTTDGRALVFERSGGSSLQTVPADGSRTAQALGPEGHYHPHGWTTTGDIVAVRMGTNPDLVAFGTAADAAVRDLIATRANEGLSGRVSPDGRWLAYSADTTGRSEIWVRPLTGDGAAARVSPAGGFEPVWSPDGRELYYLSDEHVMAVEVEPSGAGFNFKAAVPLFGINMVRSTQPPSYDALADGRFVMFTSTDEAHPPVSVVVNWTRALARRGGQ